MRFLNSNKDGQLGRETAASFPAPINFPARSFVSSDDTRNSGSLRSGNLEGKQTKVQLLYSTLNSASSFYTLVSVVFATNRAVRKLVLDHSVP